MKRFKLVVAYDGTNYCGWQIQPNGITIEGVLNKTLSDFLKEHDIDVVAVYLYYDRLYFSDQYLIDIQ